MVNALNPADHMAVKDEIITDLVNQCRSNQQKLMQFVSSTGYAYHSDYKDLHYLVNVLYNLVYEYAWVPLLQFMMSTATCWRRHAKYHRSNV